MGNYYSTRHHVICFIALGLVLSLAIPMNSSASTVADYNYVFENQEILTFTIEMTAENFQAMQPKPKQRDMTKMSSSSMFAQEFPYVPATVTCGGAVYEGVGVRYRGNASIMMIPPGGKKPLKIDFNRFNDEQVFHGFTKLNFINCFRDPSMLRDKLTYDLYRKVGVPASRATFANIYLAIEGKPQEHLGFFVVVEQVNRQFLEDRFGNYDGGLFKFEIMSDLEYRGDMWDQYAHDHEMKSGGIDDAKQLIKFIKFLHDASDKEFAAKIERKLNVDRFLASLAVNTLLTDLDSYAGLGHNWYMYYNTDSNRFEYIPWDVNEAFGNLQVTSPEKMLNFDIKKPYMGDKIMIQRILDIEKYRVMFEFYLSTFIRDFFNPAAMNADIDLLYSHIKDSVQADSNPIFPFEDFQKSIEGPVKPRMFIFSQQIIGLKPFVKERTASVKAQLAGEKEGDRIDNMMFGRPGGPRPGSPRPGGRPGGPPPFMRQGPGGPPPGMQGGQGGPPPGMSPFPPQKPLDEETKKKIELLKDDLQKMDQSIKETPDKADLYVKKGEILGQLTELAEPMDQMIYGMQIGKTFDKALEIDPENIGGRLGRGAVRFFTPEAFGGDIKGAISDFEFVLKKDPNFVQAHIFMGMAYQRQDKKDKALKHLQKAVEIDPDNKQAKDLLKSMQ